ncbi:hypothetical protein PIB30_082681 [Stylosanthes scabra]|uniref:Uncharacterized protein n=1 Tax=Stylosanthes scabra TaxID=79078 RepID=A0ABU6XRF8_9FABA|nr:hypothetical protein [Stylosanthes scabra]
MICRYWGVTASPQPDLASRSASAQPHSNQCLPHPPRLPFPWCLISPYVPLSLPRLSPQGALPLACLSLLTAIVAVALSHSQCLCHRSSAFRMAYRIPTTRHEYGEEEFCERGLADRRQLPHCHGDPLPSV